jgi:hypothetical protein
MFRALAPLALPLGLAVALMQVFTLNPDPLVFAAGVFVALVASLAMWDRSTEGGNE